MGRYMTYTYCISTVQSSRRKQRRQRSVLLLGLMKLRMQNIFQDISQTGRGGPMANEIKSWGIMERSKKS